MHNPIKKVTALYQEFQKIRHIPRTNINLMLETTLDNPYYHELTTEYYQETRQRHPRLPLIRRMEWGVALCLLPDKFEDYFMLVEGAARRNYKKAKRLGYVFGELDYNNHLEEVTAIHHSTNDRQGKLPEDFIRNSATVHNNPPSLDPEHDYPYFGIFNSDGQLAAYASCFIAGEYCNVQRIYGHAAHQSDGCVPLLIISIAEHLYHKYPKVSHYAYGTFYGANPSMKRFKRKFHFLPHRVNWQLKSN